MTKSITPVPEQTSDGKFKGICMWEWDDAFYSTTCGKGFYFETEGRPEAHGFKYCPFCGKVLSSR